MKLLKPKGWLSQGFGLNDVDYKLYGYKGHPGVDFVQGFKSSIVACGDGKIYKTLNKNCPNLSANRAVCQLVEDGGLVYEIVYLHCLDIITEVGDFVVEGQPIATEGNTGAVWTVIGGTTHELTLEERLAGIGSHLHFGFRPCKKVSQIENGKTYLHKEFGDIYFDGSYYEVLYADNGLDGFIDPTPYFYTPTFTQILEAIKRSLKNILKSL
jgi:murein DD-endopeptidase MepM/ murein hydrolase activator NlpD